MSKDKRVVIIVFFVFLLLFIGFCIFNHSTSITLIFGGDTLVTDYVLEDAYISEKKSYDFSKMFKYLKEYVNDYDLAFYNQETPISGSQFEYKGDNCYNTPSIFADTMIDVGFNMVSLANNHVFDGEIGSVNGHVYCYKSEIGVVNSIKYWRSKNVYYSGSYLSDKERNNIIVKEKNGIKYSLLSYTYGLNIETNFDEVPFMVNLYDPQKVKKDIESVRNKVDLLIVSMHWGYENELSFVPNKLQEEQAKYLASLGVDIVIGHHPYVIQPIEKINNTFVFYSLGRIISNKLTDDDYAYLIGVMPSFKVSKKIVNGKNSVLIENIGNELIFNYYDSNRKNTLIIPFSKINEKYLKDYKRIYQKYSKILKMRDSSIIVNLINER